LLFILPGCYVKGVDGRDGSDGLIFATFYYTEDVESINVSGFLRYLFDDIDSSWSYTGEDGIQSDYFIVIQDDGTFSWQTKDGRVHTATAAFQPNKGEKGEKGKGQAMIYIQDTDTTHLDGEDGDPGRNKFMVIRLENDQVTFFDNTCSDYPCETKSVNPTHPQIIFDGAPLSLTPEDSAH
jgi:hypothetical protein